jgi:hypothetical protein
VDLILSILKKQQQSVFRKTWYAALRSGKFQQQTEICQFETEDGIITVYNRIGLPCRYTTEIARDLWEIHQIDVRKTFQNMYGTCFNIKKKHHSSYKNITTLEFTLISNDERDTKKVWLCGISNRW